MGQIGLFSKACGSTKKRKVNDMKNAISVVGLVVALHVGATAATAEEVNGTGEGGCTSAFCVITGLSGVKFANPLDSSTWWDGSDHATHETYEPIKINPFDPEFLMKFPDPETHSTLHAAFTNPTTWGQFFKPETYTGMVSTEVAMKWMDPQTFSVLIDPQTYAYLAQPGAYMHVLNVDHYAKLVDMTAYGSLFDDVSSHWTGAEES